MNALEKRCVVLANAMADLAPDLTRHNMRTIFADALVKFAGECRDADDSGWLIERADSEPAEPWYWSAGAYWLEPITDPGRLAAWTQNHNEAIRFARKDDAEKLAKRLLTHVEVRVCQHVWS